MKEDWKKLSVQMDPVTFAGIGRAAGTVQRTASIAVAGQDTRAARALAGILAGSIQSMGVQVMDFGCTWRALFDFYRSFTACTLGIYVSDPVYGYLQVIGEESVLSELEQRLKYPEEASSPGMYGEHIFAGGIRGIYDSHLLKGAPKGLAETCAAVRCTNHEIRRLLERTLTSLGCRIGEGEVYCISADGTELHIEQEAGILSEEETWLLAHRTGYRFGRDALQMTVHLLYCQRMSGSTLEELRNRLLFRETGMTLLHPVVPDVRAGG